jgi:hypothetical protein
MIIRSLYPLLFLFLFFIQQVSAEDTNPRKVHKIKVTSDKAPDTSSLKNIVESVTKGLKNNDDKAIAIYNYLIYNNYHLAYPSELNGVAVLKELNVYGWSLCGGLHTLEAALWREMGWKWRYSGWSDPGHTTAEAFYDEKWHYLDVFLKFYAWKEDSNAPGGRTIASQEDIKNQPSLVVDNFVFDSEKEVYYQKGNEYKTIQGKANWMAPVFLPCRDSTSSVAKGTKTWANEGVHTTWSGIKFDEDGYSADINLTKGMTLNLMWSRIEGAHWWKPDRKAVPQHSCSDRDFRNSPSVGLLMEPYRQLNKGQGRSYSNGNLEFKPVIDNTILASFESFENVKIMGNTIVQIEKSKPSWLMVNMSSPYVMALAKARVNDLEEAEVSVDNGKSFKVVALKDFSDVLGGCYSCLLKIPVSKPISSIEVEIIVQHNCRALPYLSPGKNEIIVSLLNPEELNDRQLVITYVFQTGYNSKSFEQFIELGKEIAKSHYTDWGPEVFYVQKIIKNTDFNQGQYQFNINIGTPNGKFPAYPRMIYLKREVIGLNQSPQPLPDGAVLFKEKPDQELMTLPYPFHMDLNLQMKSGLNK